MFTTIFCVYFDNEGVVRDVDIPTKMQGDYFELAAEQSRWFRDYRGYRCVYVRAHSRSEAIDIAAKKYAAYVERRK